MTDFKHSFFSCIQMISGFTILVSIGIDFSIYTTSSLVLGSHSNGNRSIVS